MSDNTIFTTNINQLVVGINGLIYSHNSGIRSVDFKALEKDTVLTDYVPGGVSHRLNMVKNKLASCDIICAKSSQIFNVLNDMAQRGLSGQITNAEYASYILTVQYSARHGVSGIAYADCMSGFKTIKVTPNNSSQDAENQDELQATFTCEGLLVFRDKPFISG